MNEFTSLLAQARELSSGLPSHSHIKPCSNFVQFLWPLQQGKST